MQAADYVKYADLVAAGIASQSGEMQQAIKDYKQAVAEWDKRNDLSKELLSIEGKKAELANAQTLLSREQAVFRSKVEEFNAKVDKAEAADKARKVELVAQLKKVEEAVALCEKKEVSATNSLAARSAELAKQAATQEAFQQELNKREQELALRENKLKAAQVSLGKALA